LDYLLPVYAVHLQNILLGFRKKKSVEALQESAELLDHEIGQIDDGVGSLTFYFKRYCDDAERDLIQALNNIDHRYLNKLDTYFSNLLRKAKFFSEDMEGQFHLIKMMSRLYAEDLEVHPHPFDMYHQFLNKWQFSFNRACQRKNVSFQRTSMEPKDKQRWLFTEPNFLEHTIYNIVNNAIKYSFVNTRINLDITKSADDKFHLFTVTNYGDFLDPNNRDIFHKGVRKDKKLSIKTKPNCLIDGTTEEDKTTEGKGLGLYWSDKLATALQGEITFKCEKVSDYYVPFIRAIFDRYADSQIFQKVWDELDTCGLAQSYGDIDLTYDSIKNEFNRLKKNGIYDKIVINDKYQEDFKKLGVIRLFDELGEPTYKVSFTIKIPRYEGEKCNGQTEVALS